MQAGLTTGGGVAIKTEKKIGDATLNAGIEIRKDEKPRVGINFKWRF